MTNTKLFLLIGTSLSFIPTLTSAQCVATQDCATLGYTETSCSGGSGVKCPFGNKWACFKSESEICNDLGFTLSCTGTNQTSGVGKVCNGKYSECTCASGYNWNDSSQQCEYTCVIGALYYADGTCSNDYISSKKLLGIVIYEKSASQNGWVMTHKPVATGIAWGGYGTDISGLTNITSESKLTDIQASCTNTDKITAQGNSSAYPAAWAAKNYKEGGKTWCLPSGYPAAWAAKNYKEGGKTWCLPSGGLLKNALDNSAIFTKFNAAVYKIQASAGTSAATILGNVYKGGEVVWSSSEYSRINAWDLDAGTSGSFSMDYNKGKNYSYSGNVVRPVLAF